jgi:hypothetical protein
MIVDQAAPQERETFQIEAKTVEAKTGTALSLSKQKKPGHKKTGTALSLSGSQETIQSCPGFCNVAAGFVKKWRCRSLPL